MTSQARSRASGRPFRALQGLGLLLLLWLAWRTPQIVVTARAAVAAMRPVQDVAGRVPPPRLLALLLRAPVAAPVVPVLLPPVPKVAPKAALPTRLQPILVVPPVVAAPPPVVMAPLLPVAAAATPDPGALAEQAYQAAARGDRRLAVRLFDAALAAGEDARNADWQRARSRLMRHWSGDAWLLARAAGAVGPTATAVLGGGQAGASIAYAIDPLARRPLALAARVNIANGSDGAPRGDTAQMALGLRWQPDPHLSLSGERLVALGPLARDDWTLRIAGGGEGRVKRLLWSSYAEAGVQVAGDGFAGGQARLAFPLEPVLALSHPVSAGAGVWGSVQGDGTTTIARLDIGPSLAATLPIGRASLRVNAEWRFRVAGQAAPGSGPAVTISTGF